MELVGLAWIGMDDLGEMMDRRKGLMGREGSIHRRIPCLDSGHPPIAWTTPYHYNQLDGGGERVEQRNLRISGQN